MVKSSSFAAMNNGINGHAEGDQRQLVANVAPPSSTLLNGIEEINRRLSSLEVACSEIAKLLAGKHVEKELYTTHEVAKILGKRPFTVREWCRLGRVHAQKAGFGRGDEVEWRISLEELRRIQNEGLLPLEPVASLRRSR